MEFWDNALVNPPLARKPTKMKVNASIYGLVIAILTGVGLLLSLLSLFALSSVCNLNAVSVCGFPVLSLVGEFTVVAGMILCVVGGLRLYKFQARGRAIIVYGFLLGVVGGIIYSLGYPTLPGGGATPFGIVISIALYAVLYYYLMIARFPE